MQLQIKKNKNTALYLIVLFIGFGIRDCTHHNGSKNTQVQKIKKGKFLLAIPNKRLKIENKDVHNGSYLYGLARQVSSHETCLADPEPIYIIDHKKRIIQSKFNIMNEVSKCFSMKNHDRCSLIPYKEAVGLKACMNSPRISYGYF